MSIGDLITDFDNRMNDVDSYFNNKQLSNIQIVTDKCISPGSGVFFKIYPLNAYITVENRDYRYMIWLK